jgi:glutathione S-transferase
MQAYSRYLSRLPMARRLRADSDHTVCQVFELMLLRKGCHQAPARAFAGAYSIADMASDPWIVLHEQHGQILNDFSNLERWFETIERCDAVQRAREVANTINTAPTVTEKSKAVLFGQGRRSPR